MLWNISVLPLLLFPILIEIALKVYRNLTMRTIRIFTITIICWRFEPVLHILQFFYHMLYSKLLVHETSSAFHVVTLPTAVIIEQGFVWACPT